MKNRLRCRYLREVLIIYTLTAINTVVMTNDINPSIDIVKYTISKFIDFIEHNILFFSHSIY